jgi:branched-chain amino acid transport system ATP-binding protein
VSESPLLAVSGLNAYYGAAHILFDLALDVEQGEVVALMGRNGAGKSTTLKSIMGMVERKSGVIRLADQDISDLPTYETARLGLGFVPEDRRIFTDLTVTENLEVGRQPARGAEPWTPERLFDLFPNLAEARHRLGGRLSGGEQQMLVIARALLAEPELMMIDEASMGLAPNISEFVFETIGRLAAGGLTVLVTEQYVRLALEVAGRGYVLKQGHIDVAGSAAELRRSDVVEASYLGGVS